MVRLAVTVLVCVGAIGLVACSGTGPKKPDEEKTVAITNDSGDVLVDCPGMLRRYQREINVVDAQFCNNKIRIQCDVDQPELGVTVLDAAGNVNISFRVSVGVSTVRHELVHALDICLGITKSRGLFRIVPGDTNAKKTIRATLETLFYEYLSYGVSESNPLEDVFDREWPQFANPDDSDKSLLSAYKSLKKALQGGGFTPAEKATLEAGLGFLGIKDNADMQPTGAGYTGVKAQLEAVKDEVMTGAGVVVKKFQDGAKYIMDKLK